MGTGRQDPRVRGLVVALVVLFATQLGVVLVRAPKASVKLGAAAAAHPDAPPQSLPDLLLADPPPGFAPIPGAASPVDAEAIAVASPDPQKARAELETLGFRGGYRRTWSNPGLHQFVIAVVVEYRSPGAAANAKRGDERTFLQKDHSAFPVTGIPGAIGIKHAATLPGKAPQTIYTALFRVDRWVFDIAGGFNAGLPGSTDPSAQLAQQSVTLQYTKVRAPLGQFLSPAPDGDHLRLADPVCTCEVAVPASWDTLPYDAKVFAANIQAARQADPTFAVSPFVPESLPAAFERGYLFGAQSPIDAGNSLVLVFRVPAADAPPESGIAQLLGLIGVSHKVGTIRLPIGLAKSVRIAVPLTIAGVGHPVDVTEDLVVVEHAGWTYIMLVGGTGTNTADFASIEQSLRA
jgi:hypothetical protein